jgi:hypothetical protein
MRCESKHFMERAMQLILALSAAAAPIATAGYAQSRALPPQDRRSPDGHYEWRIEAHDAVRYELVEAGSRRVLAVVKDYFHDQGHALAARHAQGVRVYWNDRSNLVALDEFDYRRAGRLYLFWIQNGKARPIPFDGLVRPPASATETRFCVRHGWESAARLSIRLAAQLSSGEVISKEYTADLADPTHPKVQTDP